MARRLLLGCAIVCGASLIATPAYACGGLIGPNGAVNLARTTTLAARFDAAAAVKRGQRAGDGTPIHLTIPTNNPWVPLRILALGKQGSEVIDADVFLLTDNVPAMLPQPVGGRNLAGAPLATGMQL